MKALLLAAGEGSRLRPLTISKPKPMIRAANKPIAQYAVESCVANGIRDLTFVVGYQRAKLQTYFADGRKLGAHVHYAFQESLLGTAHGVATAPDPRSAFLVLGADNVVDAALIKSVLHAPGHGVAMAVHRSETPSKYGVVSMDGSSVRAVNEKPPDPRSDWVNTGVYRFPVEYHAKIRAHVEQGRLGMTDVLQALIDEGERVEAVKSHDLWADAVYPWDLLKVHAELTRIRPPPPVKMPGVTAAERVLVGADGTMEPNVVLGAGTCIGSNVRIGAGSIVNNCVLYDDVQIGPGSILENTIVGEGTRVGPRFTAVSGECTIRKPDGWHHLEDFGAVVGEDARIGGNVTLKPGTVIGNRARVDHGRSVQGQIDDQAIVQ